MTDEEIHIGDIGTEFVVTVNEGGAPLNISTATVKEFIFKSPAGVISTKTATFKTTGADGKLTWTTTVVTDLPVSGTWHIQVRITMTGTWKSSVTTFEVYPNLV